MPYLFRQSSVYWSIRTQRAETDPGHLVWKLLDLRFYRVFFCLFETCL